MANGAGPIPVDRLETAYEIAAPHLVGPQHAPDDEHVHTECEWKHGHGLASDKAVERG